MKRLYSHAVLSLFVAFTLYACGGGNSTPPAGPTPVKKPASISGSMAASGKPTATGFEYTLTIQLHESAGTGARIDTIDLEFLKDGAVFAGTAEPFRSEAWLGSNLLPPNGGLSTGTLGVTDDVSGTFAERVDAKIGYVDNLQNSGSVTISANISPLPGGSFPLSGTVREVPGNFLIRDARIEVRTGAASGQSVQTDSNGHYAFGSLPSGNLTIRASKAEYTTVDQLVVLDTARTLDFNLSKGSNLRAVPSATAAITGTRHSGIARLPHFVR